MTETYLILRESGAYTELPGVKPGAALHAAFDHAKRSGVVGWLAWISGSLAEGARRAVIRCGTIGAPRAQFMRAADRIGAPQDQESHHGAPASVSGPVPAPRRACAGRLCGLRPAGARPSVRP